jgi:hypothetical protein
MSRNKAHTEFIAALQKHIDENISPGYIITTRTMKSIVKALPDDHEILSLYNEYIMACGHASITNWKLTDYNRLANHMKYLNGYYRDIAYQKRVGSGANARYVTVKAHRIKV